jgi:hypothetical protein
VFQVFDTGLLGDMENVSFLLNHGAVAILAPARQDSREAGRLFALSLEGFSTAAIAEARGRQLSQAILWTAISLDHGLRLDYRTKEPAAVFDRTVSEGASALAGGMVVRNPQAVQEQLLAGFDAPPIDPRSLLSMEIFCSASLEAGDRAKFITAVSALEPLAEAQPVCTENLIWHAEVKPDSIGDEGRPETGRAVMAPRRSIARWNGASRAAR